MGHFFNPDLRVANAVTVEVDFQIVQRFAQWAQTTEDTAELDVVRPDISKWNSDIRWISARTPTAFGIFEAAFEQLCIADRVAQHLDLDKVARLYFGSIVVRSRCEAPFFHCDWEHIGNQAFTALTPIGENNADFGLLYKDFRGEVRDYSYRPGEAIVFGDMFRHSTKPGQSQHPVALLCFEFGSDKMEHWDKILNLLQKQARLFRLPNGEFFRDEQPPAI